MCVMLGSEPIESEIPIEYDDLPEDVQEAILVYNMLQDNWDTMNGLYLGKYLGGIGEIFNIAQIEDKQTCFSIIQTIDQVRAKLINDRKPAKQSA
jgi:hypothetical protein